MKEPDCPDCQGEMIATLDPSPLPGAHVIVCKQCRTKRLHYVHRWIKCRGCCADLDVPEGEVTTLCPKCGHVTHPLLFQE